MGQTYFLDKGPAHYIWDYGGTNILLNKAYEGGQINFKQEYEAINIDQFGGFPVSAIVSGGEANISIPIAQKTLHQLSKVVPASNYTAEGNLQLSVEVGCDMYDLAKSMVIKPVCANVANSDQGTWTWIHKCFPICEFEFNFNVSDQRVFALNFICFPSQDSATLGVVLQMGMAT